MFVFQLYLFAFQLNIGESVKVVKAKKQNCRVRARARTRGNRFIEILTIPFFITAMLKIEGLSRRFYT